MGLFDFLKKDKNEFDDVAQYQKDRKNINNSSNVEPFKFVIEDIFSITGRGCILTGIVLSGQLKIGDDVHLNENIYTVFEMETFRKKIKTANSGEHVGILLKGLEKSEVNKGDILTK